MVLVLSGHDHEGAYGCVDGVHFLVPQAMLEAPTGGNAFAFCHVYHDHLHVKGVGTVTSRKLALPDRLVQLG